MTYDNCIPDDLRTYYADPPAYSDPNFVPHWAVCEKSPIAKKVPASTRTKVLDRDGRRCLACATTEDLTVDHVKHRSRGGGHEPENLRALCRPYNSRRGARLLPEADG